MTYPIRLAVAVSKLANGLLLVWVPSGKAGTDEAKGDLGPRLGDEGQDLPCHGNGVTRVVADGLFGLQLGA